VAIAVESGKLEKILGTGHHLVNLCMEADGGVMRALVKEVQVAAITDDILHVDFVEIASGERVSLAVPLVFRGEAAGSKEGGVIDVKLHELEIECPAEFVVDEIRVSVSPLGLGESLHVEDLVLPEGVVTHEAPTRAIVSCRRPREETAEAEGAVPAEAEAPAQPEVISEKKREEREKEREAEGS
jgi:large subunit ribosomal protein L25